jgi:hypothetical protein
MSKKAHGQVRQSQVITTYGPGSLIDLPTSSAIVGGLDSWPNEGRLTQVLEPRLSRKLELMTQVKAPRLYAPPPDSNDPQEPLTGISVWRFPEWFLVQHRSDDDRARSRRLVRRAELDGNNRFEGHTVVATRFVRACRHGHVDDIDWREFVHGPGSSCYRPLTLHESGTGGDLIDLTVRCECKRSRGMHEASQLELRPLGNCTGRMPWLGRNVTEPCNEVARLLIRTASNAYFPLVVSVLSLPDRASATDTAVRDVWDDLQNVENADELKVFKKKPKVADRLHGHSDEDVLAAINRVKHGKPDEKPVKQVELDAIIAAPEGYGEDIPPDPDFFARRLPDQAWRSRKLSEPIASVVQLHRLREVVALTGFTRFEALTRDIDGEYDSDVKAAKLALEPRWFPAIENRGEGVFVQLRADDVHAWLAREEVKHRVDSLMAGHARWAATQKGKTRSFPGGPYVLLHTLSHLLIQSLALRCGYPASSIRERIYVDVPGGRFGVLLYTGSPDAEGTLGGLVQQARAIEEHLAHALRNGRLCSHDPICAHHSPGESMEGRWLLGAACHGCALIAEPSCEMRNDYLDRALVVPVLGESGAAFFTRR